MGTSHLILEANNISKIYKENKNENLVIFEDSSFFIKSSEIVALIGSSGCGKTTLLQVCGLLDKIDSGEIIINSINTKNISNEEKTRIRKYNIGFVYQMHHLFPEFSAIENVMLPLLANNEKKETARKKALIILESFKLLNKVNCMPSELSGGEKQRVAIARAIVNRPSLILADEPTGNLDDYSSNNVLNFLFKNIKEFNLSLFIVTHNIDVAKKADRILTIKNKKIENIKLY